MPDWINITLRAVGAVAYLFLLTKIIGKRQIKQLTYIEYIVGISIGSIAAFMATEMDGPIYHSLIAMGVFALFPVLMEWLSLKSKFLRDLFEGKATVLIKEGKILEDNLKKERLTAEDLMEHLRVKNVFRVADVEFALMETSGEVSVLLKSESQPVTPKHLELTVAPSEENQIVILDGVIMDEPLATAGLNRRWVRTELQKAGVALENVFLGQVDKGGELYLDLYDDKLMVPGAQAMKLAFATLKKCQADLELYALSTKNEQMKRTYQTDSEQLQQIIDQVKPFMIR
ncbi:MULTISPECIES: DUF421 domain-containing protein [Brevibacillus]|uniref:DUF421 domain-containing protein n=1 Tax=Brevibacillus TaxID=55080 RepID=UPI000D0EEEA6|nr:MULTISPECIES: DUF421 domain-containing protein [Brevibacillus]PSJ69836.1 hypothetical protein C7J99_08725 [Brevibacillus brevis]RED25883.1 uncharacterized membrane protein YcaP (DUF421 family) [Brevibacillus brevis]TQK74424.1 uncharacterized membrane protein YcaP (DUF421 family) [Brevibacillus sp. AG162]VEF88173.1 Protein of uncharacterised function (DUF421) [Brevibacillus brevis]GEC89031.1 hypothetical protein BBR01nite_13620 [Brevibacillus brevis]